MDDDDNINSSPIVVWRDHSGHDINLTGRLRLRRLAKSQLAMWPTTLSMPGSRERTDSEVQAQTLRHPWVQGHKQAHGAPMLMATSDVLQGQGEAVSNKKPSTGTSLTTQEGGGSGLLPTVIAGVCLGGIVLPAMVTPVSPAQLRPKERNEEEGDAKSDGIIPGNIFDGVRGSTGQEDLPTEAALDEQDSSQTSLVGTDRVSLQDTKFPSMVEPAKLGVSIPKEINGRGWGSNRDGDRSGGGDDGSVPVAPRRGQEDGLTRSVWQAFREESSGSLQGEEDDRPGGSTTLPPLDEPAAPAASGSKERDFSKRHKTPREEMLGNRQRNKRVRDGHHGRLGGSVSREHSPALEGKRLANEGGDAAVSLAGAPEASLDNEATVPVAPLIVEPPAIPTASGSQERKNHGKGGGGDTGGGRKTDEAPMGAGSQENVPAAATPAHQAGDSKQGPEVDGGMARTAHGTCEGTGTPPRVKSAMIPEEGCSKRSEDKEGHPGGDTGQAQQDGTKEGASHSRTGLLQTGALGNATGLAVLGSFVEDLFPLLTAACIGAALKYPATFAWAKSSAAVSANLALMMFSVGTLLSPKALLATLRSPKAWQEVAVSVTASYTIMPALALGLAWLLPLPRSTSLGLLLVSLATSTPASSLVVAIGAGDVPLSFIAGLVTSLAGSFMTGSVLGASMGMTLRLASSTLMLCATPTALGMLLRHSMAAQGAKRIALPPLEPTGVALGRKPGLVADTLTAAARSAGVVAAAGLAGGAAAMMGPAMLTARLPPGFAQSRTGMGTWVGPRALSVLVHVSIFLLHALGAMGGYLTGIWMGVGEASARTLAMESSLKSSSLAYVLSQAVFGPGAGAEFAAAASLLWTSLIGSIMAVIWKHGKQSEPKAKESLGVHGLAG